MSFDIFNYAPTIAEIDSTISALNSRVLISTRRQCDIAAMFDSAKDLMAGESRRLVESIATDNNVVNELTEIKKKIQLLCDLPLTVKNQLYSIYCVMSERNVVSVGGKSTGEKINTDKVHPRISLGEFATRLPVCYEGLMIDVIPLLKHIPADERQEKMLSVYKKYELLQLPVYYRWMPPESIM